jgi:hypothetical protein
MTPAQLKASAAVDPKPPAGLSPEAKAAFDSQIAATRRASEYLAESMNIK